MPLYNALKSLESEVIVYPEFGRVLSDKSLSEMAPRQLHTALNSSDLMGLSRADTRAPTQRADHE